MSGAVLLLLLGAASFAEARATEIPQKIFLDSGGEKIRAELFMPDGKKFVPPYPALIAIHEWWGLNDQVRAEARQLAAEGFVVLAVDLYRGRVAKDADEAHELMRGLPHDRALGDLKAAFDYLAGRISRSAAPSAGVSGSASPTPQVPMSLTSADAGRPDVWPDKIGAIGWCMGGGWSLELAAADTRLAACVIYYGRLITDPKRLAGIKASVSGFFGEDDRGIPPESVRAFEKEMKKRKNCYTDIHIYPNAGHAFANATRPSYNKGAADDAWAMTIENLKSDLDDTIFRIRKINQFGDTGGVMRDYPLGTRLVYTIYAENDGNGRPDSVTIVEFLDTRLALDLTSVGGYGDIFTDSAMPTWGGTFNIVLEYMTRKDAEKYKNAGQDATPRKVYRPLNRKTSEKDVGAARWKFLLTSGDKDFTQGKNIWIGPDNKNDDRRQLDGLDTSFGASADADAGYVRFAVRVVK